MDVQNFAFVGGKKKRYDELGAFGEFLEYSKFESIFLWEGWEKLGWESVEHEEKKCVFIVW